MGYTWTKTQLHTAGRMNSTGRELWRWTTKRDIPTEAWPKWRVAATLDQAELAFRVAGIHGE
jgi:hypothetical protein